MRETKKYDYEHGQNEAYSSVQRLTYALNTLQSIATNTIAVHDRAVLFKRSLRKGEEAFRELQAYLESCETELLIC